MVLSPDGRHNDRWTRKLRWPMGTSPRLQSDAPDSCVALRALKSGLAQGPVAYAHRQTYAALRAKNQAPQTDAIKALSKPKCKQCGQREMEFTEYRSPWHTKNDIDLFILP